MTVVVVIAKECLPGRVKTRLSPPFSPAEAARLAQASLHDTFATVASLPASRRVLYFDGSHVPAAALSSGFEVLAQVGGGLDVRLAHLFDLLAEPTLLVGMDTPQLGATDVAAALESLTQGGDHEVDCWFGPAADGGFWALGMRDPRGDLVRGVPMSRDDTGARQLHRLEEAGLSVGTLPVLTDLDTVADAFLIAATAPDSRFAREFRRLTVGQPS
ncbi:glycosyltransferase [Agromyces sp. SYSU K20354]|uniref:TIGR04282 family arsenosugar biosynthesis glycosyltransferase n=1 Tax=Agromyces cavernae TaxID=2898659 RepID=UPI001E48B216|nr:TIGR04282 family arsenosugar biosynthesis glycosyltransferase [Agromyces cavernae]MCD2442046.1 glycosyltransferase [Agromyces cavernae]